MKDNTGIGGTYKPFTRTSRNKTQVEKIYEANSSNAYISLGKDRVASPFSGYGNGGIDCDAIDIVVGPLGKALTEDVGNEKVLHINPNFKTDKARIYITQKGNIDEYFGLQDGVTNEKGVTFATSVGKSAIALKADHLRLISREAIKIVSSGTDDTTQKAGVYIIAQNDESKLQPMVLGDNLVEYIDKQLIKSLSEIFDIIHQFMHTQAEFNSSVMVHTHVSPFFAIPTSISLGLVGDGCKNLLNTFDTMLKTVQASANNEVGSKFNLLPLSKKYFLSKYHKVN